MLFALTQLALPEQELVSLVTTKTLATHVTPESGLVLQDILTIPTRVETQLRQAQTMATDTLKLWATS